MPKSEVSFDSVRKIALAMPGVEESTMYGSPAFKLHGRLLACMAIHKSAEPGSLVVTTGFDERMGLLEEAPDTYYVTDHYVDYPSVLVRLSRIGAHQLRDLLGAAWRFVSAGEKQKASGRARTGKVRTAARGSGGRR